MARIRTIKPDFCTSADTGALSLEARLFFLQLLTDVDDEGRCIYVPKRLAGALYPFDDHIGAPEITQWVKECLARDMLAVYEVSGRRYLRVVNWHHQYINKPTPSKLPPPPEPPRDSLDFPGEPALEVEQGTGNREVEVEPAAAPRDDPTFDDFWSVYPRRADKPKAKKAWERAIKRDTPHRIISGAIRYAEDPNREDSFTKYAEGWLNGDRWNDEPLPPRARGRPSRMERTLANAAAVLGEENHGQAGNGAGTSQTRRGLPAGG